MSLADQFGLRFETPARRVWSVAALIGAVRTQLEREYTDVWVEGEISNFRPAESGHLYFTLKDDGAQLRVVMFRLQARLLRFRPENGMAVVARGRITVYEGRGELQLSAEYLEPKGAGALQVAFEQLKAKLAAEGLFDQARKKPIPGLPRRIGIVTSPRGAALYDILNILRRRHDSVGVLIYPAQVQGPDAASEVASGVRLFNRSPKLAIDVIIIARGGGSLEDLAAFNNEGLARVIAASEIPVISAVGHETDVTLCDLVADHRAATPTDAARLATPDRAEVQSDLEHLGARLARGLEHRTTRMEERLARMTDGLLRGVDRRLESLTYRLSVVSGRLDALSPLGTFARGFAVPRDGTGRVLRRMADFHPGDPFDLRVVDGTIKAQVRKNDGN